jgi:hypothetical protein
MNSKRSSWKRRERDGLKLFGARRQFQSGSSGHAEAPCSDSTHERRFIEPKLRASSSVRSPWEKARNLARRERKMPVPTLYSKHEPGALIAVHESDRAVVETELADVPERARETSAGLQDLERTQPGDST